MIMDLGVVACGGLNPPQAMNDVYAVFNSLPLDRLFLSEADRNKHWYSFSVFQVILTKIFDEVLFLKVNANQDVSGTGNGKNEMRDGHGGSCPKGDDESQV